MELIFLSEYQGANRGALIYLDSHTRSYWIDAIEQGQIVQRQHFLMKDPAEDWAEDWVEGLIDLDTP